MQKMNNGYTYAFVNVKTNKVISVHKDFKKAWMRVTKTANYKYLESLKNEMPSNFDDLIKYDVVSLFDIAFS